MSAPVELARETVRRLLSDQPLPKCGAEVVESELWGQRAACFVSIKFNKEHGGDLRGCIGTLAPCQASLDHEIIENAVSSATRDPRFAPMDIRELDRVVFSVDVLSEPEDVSGLEQLDPREWGVIVSRGWQRGVLLPNLEGVDTVEQQVTIAAMKAGIKIKSIQSLGNISIQRFRVTRYL